MLWGGIHGVALVVHKLWTNFHHTASPKPHCFKVDYKLRSMDYTFVRVLAVGNARHLTLIEVLLRPAGCVWAFNISLLVAASVP